MSESEFLHMIAGLVIGWILGAIFEYKVNKRINGKK